MTPSQTPPWIQLSPSVTSVEIEALQLCCPFLLLENCIIFTFGGTYNHFHLLLISACRDWAALPFSVTCIVLCLTGGVEHHRDCAGHEQVHRLSSAASADPLCRSLWQHRALRTADWLHVADYLQAVKRPLTHQSPKGCHWRVSAGNLQVRLL